MWKNVRCTARCTVCFNIFLPNLSLSSAAVRKITLEFNIYSFLNSDLYRILKHKILIYCCAGSVCSFCYAIAQSL